MRHTWRWRLAIVAAVVMAGLVPAAPASAHYHFDSRTVRAYSGNQFCVDAYAESDHSYHLFRTFARGGTYCSSYLSRGAGAIRHRAEWYADGRYCAYIGEQQNTNTSSQLETFINQDVWLLGCNNGPGANVYISMDTWNWAAYGGYWYPRWGGNRAANITGHCHCP